MISLLQKLNDQVTISYQVTAEGGPGGIVSARDFIFIFKMAYSEDGTFVQVKKTSVFCNVKWSRIFSYIQYGTVRISST